MADTAQDSMDSVIRKMKAMKAQLQGSGTGHNGAWTFAALNGALNRKPDSSKRVRHAAIRRLQR